MEITDRFCHIVIVADVLQYYLYSHNFEIIVIKSITYLIHHN